MDVGRRLHGQECVLATAPARGAVGAETGPALQQPVQVYRVRHQVQRVEAYPRRTCRGADGARTVGPAYASGPTAMGEEEADHLHGGVGTHGVGVRPDRAAAVPGVPATVDRP